MFTGIVKAIGVVAYTECLPGLLRYAIALPADLLRGLELGASVSIDGVCQTVVDLAVNEVFFEATDETLQRTTIVSLELGDRVNVERSARLGDEIGGHLLSGHIFGMVRVMEIADGRWRFVCDPGLTKYLFPKGFVALNGCSLTLGEVDPHGSFTVHLIPETLRRTTFSQKRVGDRINLELDALTQAVVDTVLNVLKARK